MKISVTIYSLNQYFRQGKMDVKGFIEYCGGLGIDAVDLGYYWRNEEREIKLVPGWLRKNNLALAAYIVGNDFAQKEDERKRQISLVKHGIERATELKTKILRVFAGNAKPDFPDYKAAKEILISSFREVSSFAKEQGIILALENHGRLCGRPDQILDLLSKVNSSNLKLNLDIGNFSQEVNEDLVSSVRKLVHLAVHVHIRDIKKVDEKTISVVLGEGDVDLGGCLRTLKEKNYQGYLSLEYEAEIDSKVGVERSLSVLKEYLKEQASLYK